MVILARDLIQATHQGFGEPTPGPNRVRSPGDAPDVVVTWLGRFRDWFRFRLEEPATIPTAYGDVSIPAPFPFDGASIPRRCWRLFKTPAELGMIGPLTHDALYRLPEVRPPGMTRRKADAVFRARMKVDRIPFAARWAAWLACRIAGGACWQDSGKVTDFLHRPPASERKRNVARVRGRTRKRRRGWK